MLRRLSQSDGLALIPQSTSRWVFDPGGRLIVWKRRELERGVLGFDLVRVMEVGYGSMGAGELGFGFVLRSAKVPQVLLPYSDVDTVLAAVGALLAVVFQVWSSLVGFCHPRPWWLSQCIQSLYGGLGALWWKKAGGNVYGGLGELWWKKAGGNVVLQNVVDLSRRQAIEGLLSAAHH